ncbi:hypothetical protein [Sporosarcina psychrophila]
MWLAATDLQLGVGFDAVYHSEDAEESRVRETDVREALNIPSDLKLLQF